MSPRALKMATLYPEGTLADRHISLAPCIAHCRQKIVGLQAYGSGGLANSETGVKRYLSCVPSQRCNNTVENY